MDKKKPLVIIAGPTASGKSAISIALAKKINGAIISADSMQVYKYMDIGSAKIMPEEMEGVPHYLVDELMPEEEFHVARFQEMAKKALDEIYEKGMIPIVVGGTGFYIQALLYDIDFSEEPENTAYRKELEKIGEEKGAQALFDMLEKVDPKSCETIHKNNMKRVIRALEFYHNTGMPISLHNEEQREKESPYHFDFFVLTDEREKLYGRIDERVDKMMDMGLLDEVKQLKDMGYHKDMVSMQGLGYKEILSYLMGECSLEDAIYTIKRDTRHFAKRQITWFKREKQVIWLNRSDYDQSSEKILQEMMMHIRKDILC
ncbi:MAG: tRNA (adenosine(37)-N6)-dimethylallyltransferase MiaA [Lachnospiraceae bacterium]|nr:tRNA (adenosine(37)-N6)-dimethylallyltransferase MiaA [Lachnospiraceae bacterium]